MSEQATTATGGQGKAAALVRGAAQVARRLHRKADAPAIDTTRIQRILWIRLDHIGDVVMSLPTLEALRKRFPDARLDVLVRPAVAPLLKDLPHLNHVYSYDSPRFPQHGRGAGLFRTRALMRRLRQRRYDLAIEMRGDDIGRWIAYFSGAPIRLGPDRIFYEAEDAANFSYLLTHPMPVPTEPRHAVLNNLAVLEPLSIEAGDIQMKLPVNEIARATVSSKLRALGVPNSFVVVHAHSNEPRRDWSPAAFATLIDEISRRYDVTILLSGGPGDADYNHSVLQLTASPTHVINGTGKFALAELPALFSLAQWMVTIDTGPMHIAAAVGTPMIALFLPDLAPRHHPWGQQQAVVLPASGGNMQDITVTQVLQAVAALRLNPL